ncbi:MAG: tetratricopeptide repeat protein [Gammaproteobacteria bacterium]
MTDEKKLTPSFTTADVDYDRTIPFSKLNPAKLNHESLDRIEQNNLAGCYLEGHGVAENPDLAFKLFELAASKGLAIAQLNLARCYDRGIKIQENAKEAAKYYRLAADQGDPAAQNNLGLCYALGRGVEQNLEKAVHYYQLSARQGLVIAQLNLADCYNLGNGIQQNDQQAAKYFRLAADQGNHQAQKLLKELSTSASGLTKNPKEAARWYRLAAKKEKDLKTARYFQAQYVDIYHSKRGRADQKEVRLVAIDVIQKLEKTPLEDFKKWLIDVAHCYQLSYEEHSKNLTFTTGKERADKLIAKLRLPAEEKGYKTIHEILADKAFFGRTGGERYFSLQSIVCREMIDKFSPHHSGLEMPSAKEFIAWVAKQLSLSAALQSSKYSSQIPFFYEKKDRSLHNLKYDPLDALDELSSGLEMP